MGESATLVRQPESKAEARAGLWTVLAVSAGIIALYLLPLGWFGFNKPDEERYAEIAREMLISGDWITPRLNFVKYFEKPPLVYWVTALAQGTLGLSEFAARLFPACCGLFTLWLTYVLTRSMFGVGIARLAAVILATAPLFYFLSQLVILDMPLTASVTAALLCFWLAYTRAQNRDWWYRAMYTAVATGVLIKGPVAIVLPGLAVAVFLAARREWREMAAAIRIDGIAIAALIVIPWFVAVSIVNPEFPSFFFIHEHLVRYTSTSEHHEGWWFYLPILFGALAPWTLVAVADPKSWWPSSWRLPTAAQFCAAWLGSMLVFFSLSVSKLGTYVLPMLPPAAIFLALAVRSQVESGRPQGLRFTTWVLAVLGVACLLASPIVFVVWKDARSSILSSRLLIGGAVVVLTAWGVLRILEQDRLNRALWVFALGVALFLGTAITGREVATQYRNLSRAIAANAGPDDLIVTYAQYFPGLTYYTQRRVVAALGWGELDFGRQQGDNAAFFWPEEKQVLEAWKGDRRMILVISRKDLDQLAPTLDPPPIQVAAQGSKVAVANRPMASN